MENEVSQFDRVYDIIMEALHDGLKPHEIMDTVQSAIQIWRIAKTDRTRKRTEPTPTVVDQRQEKH